MDFAEAALQIAEASRRIEARGWAPATSGNYSVRLGETRVAITASGRAKGALTPEDVIEVDLSGQPVGPGTARPSAETLLHVTTYALDPAVGAVLHTHSVANTVLGKSLKGEVELALEDYEILKAFPAIDTHAARITLPIFENTQDLRVIAALLRERLGKPEARLYGYLIRGHGLYTWGSTLPGAMNSLEALEFLFACEIEMRRLRP